MINTNPIPPQFLEEWHPTLNEGMDLHTLTAFSGKKVWWLGKTCQHEWETSVSNRVRKNSPCPICIGKKILVGFNDLTTTDPELVKEWHPYKNLVNPETFTHGSGKKIWWKCKFDHEWESGIRDRTGKRKNGCPVCAGRKVLPGFNDLGTLCPEVAKEWHPEKNNKLTPQGVTKSANRKAWWLCEQGHEWEAMINNRTHLGRGCPVCVGQMIIKGLNDLEFLRPELSKEWHPDLNGELLPSQVSLSSNKKVWWLGKCSHEWKTAVANRSDESNFTNCPVCSGNVVLLGFNDLATTHPDLTIDWHPTRNSLSVHSVSRGSNEKVWWLGSKCQHQWMQDINDRVQGAGCLVCSGKVILSGFNDLATTHPKIAAEWHPTKNNSLNSQMVSKSYEKLVWWQCVKGHEWNRSVYERVRRDSMCRICSPSVSKSEQELADLLVGKGFTVKQGDRETIKKMELDIHVKAHKLAVEYNGLYWHTENKGKTASYHYDKWEKCKATGIELIQIWEDQYIANPELVKRLVLGKFGIHVNGVINASLTTCVPIPKSKVKFFMAVHNLDGFQEASSYFGLQDMNGELVFLTGVNLKDGSECELTSICSSKDVKGGFAKMVDYLISLLSPASVEYTVNNCLYTETLLIDAGFVHTVSVAPGFSYHVNAKRVSPEEYPVSRFKSDPALAWKQGLSARELADLNGLERIWDAGKSLWVKSCR